MKKSISSSTSEKRSGQKLSSSRDETISIANVTIPRSAIARSVTVPTPPCCVPRYKLVVVHGAASGQARGELYDLVSDPRETRNLWHHPDYQSVRLEILEQLCDRMQLPSPARGRLVANDEFLTGKIM